MKYFSTRSRDTCVSFLQAVRAGLAPDGGLYMPEHFPQSVDLTVSREDLALRFLAPYVGNEIPQHLLAEMLQRAHHFPLPTKVLAPLPSGATLEVLELFHGPTLAFKDFGARFMAEVLRFSVQQQSQELHILVATSGDTGGAVASAFHHVAGITVHILFPKGRISELQERQLTTLGANIKAYAVAGSFDDCQKIVKDAFQDKELLARRQLVSANSINIARLLPQALYYLEKTRLLHQQAIVPRFVVPSGNFGNLTAALFAARCGMPFKQAIAATNANDIVPHYLATGIYTPRASLQTYSNAMDVGNPSNFERMKVLFSEDINQWRAHLAGYAIDDAETLQTIQQVYNHNSYLLCPHTAVGVAAAQRYDSVHGTPEDHYVVLGTAHPAKFSEVYAHVNVGASPRHEYLESLRGLPTQVVEIGSSYQEFREAW
jgi:threonine synthase